MKTIEHNAWDIISDNINYTVSDTVWTDVMINVQAMNTVWTNVQDNVINNIENNIENKNISHPIKTNVLKIVKDVK